MRFLTDKDGIESIKNGDDYIHRFTSGYEIGKQLEYFEEEYFYPFIDKDECIGSILLDFELITLLDPKSLLILPRMWEKGNKEGKRLYVINVDKSLVELFELMNIESMIKENYEIKENNNKKQ